MKISKCIVKIVTNLPSESSLFGHARKQCKQSCDWSDKITHDPMAIKHVSIVSGFRSMMLRESDEEKPKSYHFINLQDCII